MNLNASIQNFIHPIISGFCGFLATIIGAHFFSHNNGILLVIVGILLYILANHLMLKFMLNSYQLNGATITTIITFLSQVIWMTIYKSNQINKYWVLGAFFILLGSIILKDQKIKLNNTKNQ